MFERADAVWVRTTCARAITTKRPARARSHVRRGISFKADVFGDELRGFVEPVQLIGRLPRFFVDTVLGTHFRLFASLANSLYEEWDTTTGGAGGLSARVHLTGWPLKTRVANMHIHSL